MAFLSSNQKGLAHWIIQLLSYLFSSIPSILVVVLFLSTPYIDSSPIRKELMIIMIAIVGVGRVAGLFQQQIIHLSKEEYIQAGVVIGNNPFQMYIRYYIPNLMPSMIANFFLEASRVTLLIGQLALFKYFLNQKFVIKDVGDYEWTSSGIDWLSFLASGRSNIVDAFWIPFFPALAIAILMITFQLLGEGLRSRLQSKHAKDTPIAVQRVQLKLEIIWLDYVKNGLIKLGRNPVFVGLLCLSILIGNSIYRPYLEPVQSYSIINTEIKEWVSKERKLLNVKAFAKLYGYVRFFHPSEEVTKVDWNQFALYSMNKIIKSKNAEELKLNLEKVFLPVAPTLKIYFANEEIDPYIPNFEGVPPSERELVAWQHLGVNLKENLAFLEGLPKEHQERGMIVDLNKTYFSKRVYYSIENDAFSYRSGKLFEHFPRKTNVIQESINDELKIQLPLVLLNHEWTTLGSTETSKQEFKHFVSEIKSINVKYVDETAEDIALSNIMIVWNVINYFYPYFEVVDVKWEHQLTNAIMDVLNRRNSFARVDTMQILEKMLQPLADGHINITNQQYYQSHYLPFWADVIDNQVIVTAVSKNSPFQIGDVIVKRNGENALDYINELIKLESGTRQYVKFAALKRFVRDLNGEGKEEFTIIRNSLRKEITAEYNQEVQVDPFNRSEQPVVRQLEKGIYYVNLNLTPWMEIEPFLDELANAEGIIFDSRGYPGTGSDVILYHLTNQESYNMHFNLPQNIYPNQVPESFESQQWVATPKQPVFKGRFAMIIDGSCISACETYAGHFEGNNLGVLVGVPTAGTNGSINLIKLPGDLGVWFTGMEALKVDGTQHHNIGVIPDINVNQTLEAIKQGRDEFVEAAIEQLKLY
nr:S41 family peptidase [Fredinandcohnia sp. SECRCQ15]